MLKIGITGQSGFVGTHLYHTLGLTPDEFERVPFEDDFFNQEKKLQKFVSSCDAIVHLAALNRHGDPQVIYDTNVGLVKKLISACESAGASPHILFSSSTQEERDNLYGKSKKDGRKLLEKWAKKNGAPFTGMVIPNVFGPFGNPYYNSFIATFSHQLTHGETPEIQVDGQVKLIYVSELVSWFIKKIGEKGGQLSAHAIKEEEKSHKPAIEVFHVPHSKEIKVSEVLQLLEEYRDNYFNKGILPNLDDPFERNLFNTFLCYIDHKEFFPFHLKLNTDDRGSFVETMKLNSGGQVSFSTTKPGITRGNHYHTRKAERFAVIKGKARIEIRRIGTDEKLTFELDGRQPSYVDMPVWYTHNITNIGDEELYTLFWINEHYDESDPDTWFETV